MAESSNEIRQIEKISTGSEELDRLLGGGVPVRSVSIIAGEPGSGKTVFALQMLHHLARQGKTCLYFTTLSEPAIKLIRYMQLFSFFDESLLEEKLFFNDLGFVIREMGAERALAAVGERIESDRPDVVVIDSFKAIHDLLKTDNTRTAIYDLVVQMAAWGVTTLLVGEYTREDMLTMPEFAIVDGIIRFGTERQELTSVREFEIHKLRGAGYVTGRHFFDITSDGMLFYPRVRLPEFPEREQSEPERLSTGVAELDRLLHGGLLKDSATLVQGGSGTGKTLLGLTFLVEGARRGEPGTLFTLEETPDQIRSTAAAFGWDLPELEAKGLLRIVYQSPVELSSDRFLDTARRWLQEERTKRVVLDSVTAMGLGVVSERRFRELVYAFVKHLRAMGITVLMTMEVAELLGAAQLTGHGVSSTADNLILLRYVEVEARLKRAMSVLKTRGSSHESELRELIIDRRGLTVGESFKSMRGVLTGIPTQMEMDRR